jgi:peptidyl-prolyl cis-trans isomerase C
MQLRVNGRNIPAEAIEREAARFAEASAPEEAARRALAVRELLLQRAGRLGLLEGSASREQVTFGSRADEDAVIARVLESDVRVPAPTEAECRRYYDAHPSRFTAGELVEARHILFAVTRGTPVMALRSHAETALGRIRAHPESFADEARASSNCPSAQHGGNLGQFGRGEMVPEFDRAVFASQITGVLPELVTSRHGFHIVEIVRRVPGKLLPFEVARERIAAYLSRNVEAKALQQYVGMLAGDADIEGADLIGATSPLLQ